MTRHSVRTLPAALVLLVLTTSCAGLPRAQSGPSTPSPAPTVSPADDGATPTPTSTPRGASRSAAPTRTPSPAPTSFAETYALVSSGVVRIDVQGCGSAGSGSGFLIGRDLVATVAHVVDDAATVRVTQGTRSVSADVLGLDQETDSALLRTARPLSGHVFDFSAEGPVVGERVGVIGFPAGDSGLEITQAGSKSFKEGSVNGTGRKRVIDGATRTELVELDALARGGNSGSPVFEVDGDVVGLLSAGPADDDDARARFAVNSEVAEPLIEEWTSADPVQPADCTGSVGPDGQPVPFEALPGGEAAEVAATLNLYFHSTNQADYETAYAQLHPAAQSERGLKAFSKGVRTSKDSDIQYRSVRGAGRDLVVWTTFRSEQQPQYGPEGLSCALWSLDYTMRQSGGLWLIARSAPHDGQTRYTDCVGQ